MLRTWQVHIFVIIVIIVQIARSGEMNQTDGKATLVSNDSDHNFEETSMINSRSFLGSNTEHPRGSYIKQYGSTERTENETGEYSLKVFDILWFIENKITISDDNL